MPFVLGWKMQVCNKASVYFKYIFFWWSKVLGIWFSSQIARQNHVITVWIQLVKRFLTKSQDSRLDPRDEDKVWQNSYKNWLGYSCYRRWGPHSIAEKVRPTFHITGSFRLITLIKCLKGHKSLRTLCDCPETPEEWKSDSVTDKPTYQLTG